MALTDLRGQAKIVRRAIRRLKQGLYYRRITLQGVPILFANSFPKSGTHLLTQVLQGFTKIGPAVDSGLPAIVMYEGYTGRPRHINEFLPELRRLRPGDIAYGHIHALPETMEQLCRDGFASFFILRDPRDVVVSHVHYVTEMEKRHILHRYYTENLTTFEDRLRASILGLAETQIPFPDIRERFEPYLGWLECPQVLSLRFEDFFSAQTQTIGRIYDHAVQRGFPPAQEREAAVQALAASIDPQRSPTFRSGKVGGWQAKFSPETKSLFKEVGGDLLIRLGYEQDLDW